MKEKSVNSQFGEGKNEGGALNDGGKKTAGQCSPRLLAELKYVLRNDLETNEVKTDPPVFQSILHGANKLQLAMNKHAGYGHDLHVSVG